MNVVCRHRRPWTLRQGGEINSLSRDGRVLLQTAKHPVLLLLWSLQGLSKLGQLFNIVVRVQIHPFLKTGVMVIS